MLRVLNYYDAEILKLAPVQRTIHEYTGMCRYGYAWSLVSDGARGYLTWIPLPDNWSD